MKEFKSNMKNDSDLLEQKLRERELSIQDHKAKEDSLKELLDLEKCEKKNVE